MRDEALEARIEQRVNTGLLGYWYAVLPSWALDRAPVHVTRLSQSLALWRDGSGQAHAIEDRCPHRGARLSLGWNLGDRLACWYHGIEVDRTGTVASVPAVESCPLEGTKALRAYPVQERHGAIFVYFGQTADEVPPPLGLPPELGSPAHTGMLCYANWKCNYRYAIDNLMDLMHGAYLHAASHSMARGDKSADMRLRRTETGLMFEKVGQRDLNFDWVEFGDTGTLWMRTAVPYQEKFGGGVFYIAGLTTPVDADNCVVFFWRIREASDWQADLWRFLYRTRLEGLHWDVLEQDRVVLEQLVPNARGQEFLYQHDTCLARVRRLMEEKARAQVAMR